MVDHIRQITENLHLRQALDWAVFTLGALSLTIAIAATILTHTAQTRSDSQPTEQTAG